VELDAKQSMKGAVDKVIKATPPKDIAAVVEQAVAAPTPVIKKDKTDLEFLLKQEVVQNGNDFLGIAVLTAADLPQVRPACVPSPSHWHAAMWKLRIGQFQA
jgi:hypothetical protein